MITVHVSTVNSPRQQMQSDYPRNPSKQHGPSNCQEDVLRNSYIVVCVSVTYRRALIQLEMEALNSLLSESEARYKPRLIPAGVAIKLAETPEPLKQGFSHSRIDSITIVVA